MKWWLGAKGWSYKEPLAQWRKKGSSNCLFFLEAEAFDPMTTDTCLWRSLKKALLKSLHVCEANWEALEDALQSLPPPEVDLGSFGKWTWNDISVCPLSDQSPDEKHILLSAARCRRPSAFTKRSRRCTPGRMSQSAPSASIGTSSGSFSLLWPNGSGFERVFTVSPSKRTFFFLWA